jgi:hypothetical protein
VNTGAAEGLDQAAQRQPLQIGWAGRCRGEFAAHDERMLHHVDNGLHFQRLNELAAPWRWSPKPAQPNVPNSRLGNVDHTWSISTTPRARLSPFVV